MNRIATDIDCTLFDMMDPFKKMLLKRHSARVLPQVQYQIETDPPISNDEIWDIFKDIYKAHFLCKPYPGALSYLQNIWRITLRPPILLTSRPTEYASETHSQIQSLVGEMPYQLIVVGTPADKKYMFADQLDIMVDDRIETLLHFALVHKKKGILVKQPWNRSVKYQDQTNLICEDRKSVV